MWKLRTNPPGISLIWIRLLEGEGRGGKADSNPWAEKERKNQVGHCGVTLHTLPVLLGIRDTSERDEWRPYSDEVYLLCKNPPLFPGTPYILRSSLSSEHSRLSKLSHALTYCLPAPPESKQWVQINMASPGKTDQDGVSEEQPQNSFCLSKWPRHLLSVSFLRSLPGKSSS